MNKAEKIRLLKAVTSGEMTIEEAFIKPPIVFIQSANRETCRGDNGKTYSMEMLEKFNHTIFIIPDNGRGELVSI